MFAHAGVLSLVLPLLISQGSCYLDLDTSSADSIKSTAKTLANGIISFYNETLQNAGPPGLFPTPYYFWEAGAVWNAMVEYSHLTGDSQYDELVSQALQFQLGDYNAFMPANQTKTLGNDDQSAWGLAAMTAAEVGFVKPGNASWAEFAINVWNTQALRLDAEEKSGICGGGLRWQIFSFNNGYEYKNAWSNGNFFLLSARLAKFTNNATYSQYADKVFKWSRDVKLVSDSYQVLDGTTTTSKCSTVLKVQWTANLGLFAEGAALMYNITGAQNWTEAINGFVNATSIYQKTENGYALVEVACEKNGKCDIDQRAFKGIFARSMARAALAAPIVSDTIKKMLSRSAVAAASACNAGEDAECSFQWANQTSNWEPASAKDGNLGEVFNALEIVQGLLYPSAKALQTANGTSAGSDTGNGKTNATSGVQGHVEPQNMGAAMTIPASITVMLAGAIAAVMNL